MQSVKPCPPSIWKVFIVAVVVLGIPACCLLFPALRCIPSIVYTYAKWGVILYGGSKDPLHNLAAVVTMQKSSRPASEIPRIIHQVRVHGVR